MQFEIRLLLVVMVWGINYKVIPYGVHELGAAPFTFWRFLISVLALFAFLLARRRYRVDVEDVWRLAVVGVIGTTAYQGVFAAGVARTSTVEAAMIFSLSPVFTVLLNLVVRREWLNLHQVMGIVVATLGTYVVVTRSSSLSFEDGHVAGDLLMLASAFLWALYAFVSESLLKKYGGVRVTAWSAAFGTLGLAVISWPSLDPSSIVSLSLSGACSLVFAVFGATVFGVVAFYTTIPHLGTRRVMTTMYLVPVVAMIADFVTGNAVPSMRGWLGITLVFVGVVLARSRTSIQSRQGLINGQTVRQQRRA